MTLTILAVTFLIFVLAIALLGFKAVIKQGKAPGDINTEKCSLCRMPFDKAGLIERQVGDHRLYYFCPECITELYHEMVERK